eukprot:gene18436-23555_t
MSRSGFCDDFRGKIMPTTRRDFLQTTTLLAAALPLTRLKVSGAEAASAAVSTRPARAPGRGLLFDEADLARIRANTKDPRFAAYWQKELAADVEADAEFLEKKLRLNNHVIDLLRAQRILERA